MLEDVKPLSDKFWQLPFFTSQGKGWRNLRAFVFVFLVGFTCFGLVYAVKGLVA